MNLSFRLRIAMFSVVLAGIALASFAGIALWQMQQANFTHLQKELIAQAERTEGKNRR